GGDYASVNIQGTSGINIGTANTLGSQTINIGNTNGAVAQTINIGNNTTASSSTSVTLGSLIGASPTVVQGGTSGVAIRSTGNITLGTSDTTGTLLVLDTKTDATDPTGVNGGSYYNSNTNKLRCFEAGAWKDCIQSGISNSSLASVGSVATGTGPRSVYVQGRYAYVANLSSNTLQILDVSNPASPVSVGTVSTGSQPISVYVQGRYAYVANSGSNTLQIFDVSNPASPVSVGTVATINGPISVYVQGRYAYITNQGTNTLQIIDTGSVYIQQLEVGGIETATLQTRGNATVNGDQAVVGGLTVGQSLQVSGNLGVSSSSASLFNRPTNGDVIQIASGGSVQGSISVSGSTVSYNAFTGSHYGLFAPGSTATRGELVDLTGTNQYKQGSAEPYYGIARAATA
ncbi:hypothetical protein EB077_14030, partial [bacterium]|nr:hypothetical protein [bacterium]